jgi:carbamoyl-phosphate synthase large subunit
MLHKKEIDMVVNIPRDLSAGELDNGYKIRRAAVDLNIPLVQMHVWQVPLSMHSAR